jgi:chemotaxis protein MotB
MAEPADIEEDEDEEECPKCPPVGAPAWMATFADMATLLMAFFVLILSFAEFNTPKFKMISGSLKNAFGVQKTVPVVEQPKGTTVISLEFSPSPSPSVTQEMTQETTELQKPEIEVDSKKEDSVDGDRQDDFRSKSRDRTSGRHARRAHGSSNGRGRIGRRAAICYSRWRRLR